MNPRWRAPSGPRLVSIGMQNIYFSCLSPRHTAVCVAVALRAAVGEELDFLCLGITNIPTARIPVVGTLSRPPLLPGLRHLCIQSGFWQTYFNRFKEVSDLFIYFF